ncbi:alpha-galactosidase [Lacticaseibacillus paracasei]|nr:alpha-galactosidase [Lacticaseibacillus paracasei]
MARKPPHKALGCNDQSPTITSKTAYTPVSNRASSRSV